LQELPQGKNGREAGIRLMIVGSEDDDIEFVEMTESLEATVVIDEHCTGTRYFWVEVPDSDDLLTALATRYVNRIPCPSKDWEDRSRTDHILKLAQDYRVQGTLLIQQKFCDPHECDIPPIKWLLESNGIPCLFLEFDVTTPAGQLRTRVEAFLETIRGEELF
ncbi:MAG: 2-hydroxyacyl-CoA dehydratase, partial [Dehalococcoidia bacterium]